MESGMFKREPLPYDQNYDVGLAWDDLVNHDVPWPDDDGDFGTVDPRSYTGYPFTGGGGDIGPLDDVGPLNGSSMPKDSVALSSTPTANNVLTTRGRPGLPTLPSVFTSVESATAETTFAKAKELSQPVPIPQRGSASTASTTSSSEGSPVEQLGNSLGDLDLNRGRDPSTTPIQLADTPDERWMSLVQPGEGIIFHSPVELKSRRRRLTASLLPIPVPHNKPKIRHLVLTTQRLVCVKLKPDGKISIKAEALLRSAARQKDGKEEKKDARPMINDVVAKGQKAFIVMTV